MQFSSSANITELLQSGGDRFVELFGAFFMETILKYTYRWVDN